MRGKAWLICGAKEAQTIKYALLGAAKRPPKGYIAKFGFLWAANQPGFSPQAVNIHHPTELLCFKFWLGMQLTRELVKNEMVAEMVRKLAKKQSANTMSLVARSERRKAMRSTHTTAAIMC